MFMGVYGGSIGGILGVYKVLWILLGFIDSLLNYMLVSAWSLGALCGSLGSLNWSTWCL